MHQSRRTPKSLYQLSISISLYQLFCHSLVAENLSLSLSQNLFWFIYLFFINFRNAEENKLQNC